YPAAINSRFYDDRPPCVDCGLCSGFGCPNNSKGSPAVTTLRRALLTGRCQLRFDAQACRLVNDGGHVSRVEYIDGAGKRQGVPISEDGAVYAISLPPFQGFRARSGTTLKNALRDGALGQHLLGLTMQAEDAPQRTNFVDLDPTYKDVYGLPVPRVTYKPHAYEMAARMFYRPLMKQIVENAGVPAEKVFVTPTDQQDLAAPSSRHIMGTLRIVNDSATSWTTRDRPGKKLGQFHDVDNLFACDGSVFPTSS